MRRGGEDRARFGDDGGPRSCSILLTTRRCERLRTTCALDACRGREPGGVQSVDQRLSGGVVPDIFLVFLEGVEHGYRHRVDDLAQRRG